MPPSMHLQRVSSDVGCDLVLNLIVSDNFQSHMSLIMETCTLRYGPAQSAEHYFGSFMAAVYDCISLISIPYPMSLFPVLSKRILANNTLPWIGHRFAKMHLKMCALLVFFMSLHKKVHFENMYSLFSVISLQGSSKLDCAQLANYF